MQEPSPPEHYPIHPDDGTGVGRGDTTRDYDVFMSAVRAVPHGKTLFWTPEDGPRYAGNPRRKGQWNNKNREKKWGNDYKDYDRSLGRPQIPSDPRKWTWTQWIDMLAKLSQVIAALTILIGFGLAVKRSVFL
jgi:hypothetical protein